MGNQRIIIAGDTCPIGRALAPFEAGTADRTLGDLAQLFKNSIVVANFECAFLSHNAKPIKKDGPVLGVPPSCVNGFKVAGIDIVNLANNHCLDYGEESLRYTIDVFEDHGIQCFGVTKSISDLSNVLFVEMSSQKVGFWAVSEHEFCVAKDGQWGGNPLDLIECSKIIPRAANECDHLIIMYHGGLEHYEYPTPIQQKICRFFIELGARMVICQHSHCPGSWEFYKNGLAVYGQGNFIFDRPHRPRPWYEGFLVSFEAHSEAEWCVDFIPYTQYLDQPGVQRLTGEARALFLEELKKRSRIVQDIKQVKYLWEDKCRHMKHLYFSRLLGHNRLLRFVNRIVGYTDWLHPISRKLMIRNVVECETHREVLQTLWDIGDY